MSEDFYEILGVGRDADEEEIEQAYRQKATEYHPDVSDDPNAEEKFKKLQKAKEVLSDDEKRRMYDQLGHDRFVEADKRGATDGAAGGRAGPGGAGGAGPFGGAGGPGGAGPFGGGGDIGDLFEEIFGGGGGRGGQRRERSGADVRRTVRIDLEDAYHGVETEVSFTRPETCSDCDGRGHPADSDSRTCPQCNGQGQVRQVQQTPFGRMEQTQVCPECEGEGTIYEERCGTCTGDGRVKQEVSMTIELPPGVQSGQTQRVRGEGASGPRGGADGDLLIDIEVEDHPEFDRDDADLYRTQQLSYSQAVFGDDVEVPTIDGSVEMTVPEGTSSGETFRIADHGMPRLRGRGHGDLYVTVDVTVPEPSDLTEEQREALAAFAEAGGEEIEVDEGIFERLKRGL